MLVRCRKVLPIKYNDWRSKLRKILIRIGISEPMTYPHLAQDIFNEMLNNSNYIVRVDEDSDDYAKLMKLVEKGEIIILETEEE